MAIARKATAIQGTALALGLMASAGVDAMPIGTIDETAAPRLVLTQWAYGPYGRPYYAGPYGYGPRFWARQRYYNNHFGPGAAKQRNRTRLDYCISKPERC